jgi:predicted DNA-binding protein
MKKSKEQLPMPADELEALAAYYDTHDTSAEMMDGKWVDPRPMRTTSLRLPAEVIDALKALARARGVRYTALVREIIDHALSATSPPENEELARINERLARIEAAVIQKSA